MGLDDERESASQEIGAGYKYLATGLRFAGGIVLFVVGGLFLDRWLGTSPLFILVGTVVGSGLSFLSVYRELVADKKNRPTWKGRQRGRGAGGQRGGGADRKKEP
jgi:F0F1-type ATP synthase assembly protein I